MNETKQKYNCLWLEYREELSDTRLLKRRIKMMLMCAMRLNKIQIFTNEVGGRMR